MFDPFESLRLFITNAESIARLEIGGELDMATVGALRDHLDLLVESGTGDVDVDMALVTFCDASALSALVAAHDQLVSVDRTLRIVRASSRVVRLLELTGLDVMLSAPVVTQLEMPSDGPAERQPMPQDLGRHRDQEGGVDADQTPAGTYG